MLGMVFLWAMRAIAARDALKRRPKRIANFAGIHICACVPRPEPACIVKWFCVDELRRGCKRRALVRRESAQLRTRAYVVAFFSVCAAVLFFVKFNTCASFVESWFGFLPLYVSARARACPPPSTPPPGTQCTPCLSVLLLL